MHTDPVMLDRIARSVLQDVAAQADRTTVDRMSPGVSFLGQIVDNGHYPTEAGKVYAVIPVEIDGEDVEGASVDYVADEEQVLYAVNLGTSIPAEGDKFIIHGAGGRFCFRFD